MDDDVLIAVDPHKAHNTLAVIEPSSRLAVDGGEFANTHAGYRQLMVFARTACRLHRLLAELTPGGARRELSAAMAALVVVTDPAPPPGGQGAQSAGGELRRGDPQH
jgi:hypothetical protein